MTEIDQLRSRILLTAEKLFQQFGFHKVTMDEIVYELGISKKTLYQHFSSKEELVLSVVDSHQQEIQDHIESILSNKEMDFFQKFNSIMTFFKNYHNKSGGQMRHDLIRFMPEVYQQFSKTSLPRIQRNFRTLFEEGVAQKVFREDVCSEFFLTVHGILMENLFKPEFADTLPILPNEIPFMLNSLLFKGILTRSGRESYDEIIQKNLTNV